MEILRATVQRNLLIHFTSGIRGGLVNKMGMEIGKILHFSFQEKL